MENFSISFSVTAISQTSVKSHKVSQESLGRQKSPHDEKQNRQGSPGAGGSGPANEEDEEEDGNHDTITSLAGAKMMQWYHKALTGSRKSSNVSLNQVLRCFFCGCCCYLLAENKVMKIIIAETCRDFLA